VKVCHCFALKHLPLRDKFFEEIPKISTGEKKRVAEEMEISGLDQKHSTQTWSSDGVPAESLRNTGAAQGEDGGPARKVTPMKEAGTSTLKNHEAAEKREECY